MLVLTHLTTDYHPPKTCQSTFPARIQVKAALPIFVLSLLAHSVYWDTRTPCLLNKKATVQVAIKGGPFLVRVQPPCHDVNSMSLSLYPGCANTN
jgi:hypothetical protein